MKAEELAKTDDKDKAAVAKYDALLLLKSRKNSMGTC
jgi:hypothetical protein